MHQNWGQTLDTTDVGNPGLGLDLHTFENVLEHVANRLQRLGLDVVDRLVESLQTRQRQDALRRGSVLGVDVHAEDGGEDSCVGI